MSLLGNILLSSLTNVDNTTKHELHIELEDWSGNRRFARYRGFRLGAEEDDFRLHHDNVFFGNAGEYMTVAKSSCMWVYNHF